MENILANQANDAPEVEGKESFLSFSKSSFKRIGVILRLISIPICFLAMALSLSLPLVSIQYANYSDSTTFSAARANRFPIELISGWNVTFGGTEFSYYLKSKYGPELLNTTTASFNWVSFLILAFAFLICVFAFLVTFSKKMEKFSKIVILGFALTGIAVLCTPIWFMAINHFGNTQAVATTDLTNYFLYDSLYVHCAFGSIVSCLVYICSAILFGVGTNFENAGGDSRGED